MTCRQNHTKVRILKRLYKISGKVRERKWRKAAHRDISRVWGPQPMFVALRIDATWRRNYWISLCKKNNENQPNVPCVIDLLKPVWYGSLWEEIEKTLQLNKECQLGEITLCVGRNRPYYLHLGGAVFVLTTKLGSLCNYDDDGSENVAEKQIWVFSNLIAFIWTRYICQIWEISSCIWFVKDCILV